MLLELFGTNNNQSLYSNESIVLFPLFKWWLLKAHVSTISLSGMDSLDPIKQVVYQSRGWVYPGKQYYFSHWHYLEFLAHGDKKLPDF